MMIISAEFIREIHRLAAGASGDKCPQGEKTGLAAGTTQSQSHK